MHSEIALVTKPYLKQNIPQLKAGDTVRVHQIVREGNKERIQVFEGVLIAIKGGTGISATFTVRKVSFGIGVERTFPLHSPLIVKIERIKSSVARRAKLYYLRGLSGKAARLKNEKQDYAVWEEKGAEEKIEAIAGAVAEEAEARAEERAEEEGEIKVEEQTAMTDEEKAAVAAGTEDKDLADNETPEQVAHNEAVNETKAE